MQIKKAWAENDPNNSCVARLCKEIGLFCTICYMSMAMHEFGHSLGVGDAYSLSGFENIEKNEIPQRGAMRGGGTTNTNDIEMALLGAIVATWESFIPLGGNEMSVAIREKQLFRFNGENISGDLYQRWVTYRLWNNKVFIPWTGNENPPLSDCGNWHYFISGEIVVVLEYLGNNTVETIPATVGGAPVTMIGAGIFNRNTSIASVTIPDSVEIIGNYAFAGTGLTAIELPDSLRVIGDNAFYDTQLAEFNIPDGVTHIGRAAFGRNGNLTTITIPANVESMGSDVLVACGNLVSVIFKGEIPPTISENVLARQHHGTSIHYSLEVIYVPINSVDEYKERLTQKNANGTVNETFSDLVVGVDFDNIENWICDTCKLLDCICCFYCKDYPCKCCVDCWDYPCKCNTCQRCGEELPCKCPPCGICGAVGILCRHPQVHCQRCGPVDFWHRCLGDVTGDGELDFNDALQILRWVRGLSNIIDDCVCEERCINHQDPDDTRCIRAWNAALVLGGGDTPTALDAWAILDWIIGLPVIRELEEIWGVNT
jgi:hypothetical protein